jgi:hypothetical protein
MLLSSLQKKPEDHKGKVISLQDLRIVVRLCIFSDLLIAITVTSQSSQDLSGVY